MIPFLLALFGIFLVCPLFAIIPPHFREGTYSVVPFSEILPTLVVTFSVPLVLTGIVLWFIYSKKRFNRNLIETGIPVQATIVKVLSGGQASPNRSGVDFSVLLELSSPERGLFQAQKVIHISMADVSKMQPGAKVKVVVDPKTNDIAIPGTDDA
jgi:hypothetical protein